ncbi:stress protein [Streptomyces sp. MMG1533]|uniref:CAP domain-containing protein n=1 Tax=Streptomyces sp. MMG1533 TaxID=1415546 RepID=UPI0006ADA8E3|nr:CAP domain-containing protein [Streptomyces sp. MMG1533]KOU69207.1 stress protein [Streptomyces sp. MMG1533]
MSELVPGGNLPLPGGAVTVRVPGPFDVSALITDDGGKVRGDDDFVFYNQPGAPGARLHGDTLVVDPSRLRAGATRVTVVVSPADPGTPLGRLPAPTLHVTNASGRPLARFAPQRPRQETVLLLAEIYRRGDGWKLRALGQGYADGLAGLARDFGVDVVQDTPAPTRPLPSASFPTTRPAPKTPSPSRPAPSAPSLARPAPLAPSVTRPIPPSSDAEGFLGLVNSARTAVGAPPVALDARLAAAAHAHASAMASAGRLGVEGADGVFVHQRVAAAGYAYVTVGEHLVSGPRTPAEFVAYCLRTEQPRHTLHDPAFTHVGLAHVTDTRSGDMFWTALWARPLTPADLARAQADVVDLTNRQRARSGLPPLAVDPLLATAAQAYSTDMAARAFYSHTSPEGTQPWDRAAAAGSTRRSIGENIACGQRSPAEVVEGWMNSPGHRANILKSTFTHIGVGFAGGGPAGTYWTQLFGA